MDGDGGQSLYREEKKKIDTMRYTMDDVSDKFLSDLRWLRDVARNECDDELERLVADLLRYLETYKSDGK